MRDQVVAVAIGCLSMLLVGACSGSDADSGAQAPATTGSSGTGVTTGSGGSGGSDAWVEFTDLATDFSTADVYDSNREVVHFDASAMTMVWPEGLTVSGWTVRGTDLDWDRNPVAFQVRFGTESGQRRAYFTETLTGTICDLVLDGQDALKIFATSEPPPDE